MSSTDRQNRLFVAEDWKRIYQSFRNADFQSYDFDNLRRTMITYLRENYPEDFNDYIESSEYLALIDLIAFLGQNISFRIDLNARENFLELAERRESVLRLARLLNYNPKRNQAANGLLKIVSVSTTEEIIDGNNVNLSGQTIVWNDSTNPDWYEQFIKIINATLPASSKFGRPIKKESVNGVPTEQYRTLSTNQEVPLYSFSKNIDGLSLTFEIVSSDVRNGVIQEEPPFPGNNFALLYRNDGRGPASANTGFFSKFVEGTLDDGNFSIDAPVSNQVVSIDSTNINDTDVWLYKLDNFGIESELWEKVDAVEGNNVIYNSTSKSIRNIYSVLTRVDDRISLVFADGTFGNLPKGDFRVYYRSSRNETLMITPEDMTGISVSLSYLSQNNTVESLTLNYELKYTVDNATTSESDASIKANAPSTFYVQNRMVTGEDYQIAPLNASQDILKVKAINRTASGISRYLDLSDPTGKYSSTNLFGNDGIIYKEFIETNSSFSFVTKTDVEGAIVNTVYPILVDTSLSNFYYNKFPKVQVEDMNITWNSVTSDTNFNTGYFQNSSGTPVQIGSFSSGDLSLAVAGTLVKFTAPSGYKFKNGTLVADTVTNKQDVVDYVWAKIDFITEGGIEINNDGTGPVVITSKIPTGAILSEVRPEISTSFSNEVLGNMIEQIFAYKTFGLRYSVSDLEWKIITNNNVAIGAEFSTLNEGDTSNQGADASWLILFETDGETYTILYRGLRYVFESADEIRFFFDKSDKVYDSVTGKVIRDKISVMKVNTTPDNSDSLTIDYNWEITDKYRDMSGYVDARKVEVTFFDSNEDGSIDDPDSFNTIVSPTVDPLEKYVFQQLVSTVEGSENYNYVRKDSLKIIVLDKESSLNPLSTYDDGQLFYFATPNVFKTYVKSSSSLKIVSNYRAFIGRDNLKFQYIHAADSDVRIDPSASNIIDVFMLTRSYDTAYRNWISGIGSKPLPPSSDALYQSYNTSLAKIKSVSDEIIYHPVKYKVLFGSKADSEVQAVFKVVKNPNLILNDNDIKARVIEVINEYFSLDNWDFGERFYFTELSAYVIQELTPDITTFVIVPKQANQVFGSLFELGCESDEVFISSATVDDVAIIDAVSASRLQATGGVVVTDVQSSNSGILSI